MTWLRIIVLKNQHMSHLERLENIPVRFDSKHLLESPTQINFELECIKNILKN